MSAWCGAIRPNSVIRHGSGQFAGQLFWAGFLYRLYFGNKLSLFSYWSYSCKVEDHNCKFRVSQTGTFVPQRGELVWEMACWCCSCEVPCKSLFHWPMWQAQDAPFHAIFCIKLPTAENIHTATVRTLPQRQGTNFIMALRTLVVACALLFGTCFIVHSQTTETSHAFCKIVWQESKNLVFHLIDR